MFSSTDRPHDFPADCFSILAVPCAASRPARTKIKKLPRNRRAGIIHPRPDRWAVPLLTASKHEAVICIERCISLFHVNVINQPVKVVAQQKCVRSNPQNAARTPLHLAVHQKTRDEILWLAIITAEADHAIPRSNLFMAGAMQRYQEFIPERGITGVKILESKRGTVRREGRVSRRNLRAVELRRRRTGRLCRHNVVRRLWIGDQVIRMRLSILEVTGGPSVIDSRPNRPRIAIELEKCVFRSTISQV